MSQTPPAMPGRSGVLAKLARTTSSVEFIPEIDGLRCIAILAVLVFHIAGFVLEKSPRPFAGDARQDWMFRLARTGHVGVQLFFVVSGFVVAMPFARYFLAGGKKVSLSWYFLRRLTRIEPPYIIALVFWLLAFGISGFGAGPWNVLLRHFPASLFYVHNLIFRSPSFVMPPAWSLEIEVQFYLIAPLLAYVFAIGAAWLRRSVIVLAIGAIAAVQPWLRTPGQLNGLHLGQEAHYFLLGLLLVDFYLTRCRGQVSKYPLGWDVIATLCVLMLPVFLMHWESPQLLIPVLLFFGYAGALRGKFWRAILSNPWVYTCGGMCYTIYLYHGFFKALVGRYTVGFQIGDTFWLNFLIQSAILIPAILAGSAVLFVLTEKPFMRRDWPGRLLNFVRKRPPSDPGS